MEKRNKAADLPVLTGIRFLAALMVFFYHYAERTPSFSINGYRILHVLFGEFYIGVSVFFVLSGFVIAYNYYDKDFTEKGALVNFFLKRIIRIFPLYIVLLLVYYGYYFYKGVYFTPVEYLLNFSLLKGYSNIYWNTGIVQAWSLAAEENFYLLAPLMFYFLKRKLYWLKLLAALYITGVLLFFLFKLFPLYGLFGDVHTVAFNTFFGRCFEFLTGILVALHFKKHSGTLTGSNRSPLVPGKKFTYLGIALVFFCIMLQIANEQALGNNAVVMVLINNFVVPPCVGCFLFGLLVEKTAVCDFFKSKFAVTLGYSSFAFYLLHAGIIANFFMNVFNQNTLVLLIFLQALSVIVFYTFEKPVKKYAAAYLP